MFFTESALKWLETLLQERFGHLFTIRQQSKVLLLTLPDSNGEICFDQLQSVFHQSRSNFPCRQWIAIEEGYTAPIEGHLPAPSDSVLPAPLIEIQEHSATIHYDILGLTYWMLTRLEEVGRTDLDDHYRFPATSSHAFQHGYLERPIVDEWLLILGQVIHRVWPHIELKKHEFSMKVSHDVDNPSLYAFKSWSTVCRMMTGHLLKRRDLKAFLTAPYVKFATDKYLHPADPFNTFDWLMDVSEANNLQSAFYFICGRTDRLRDADYELENPVIRNLMRRIHERGHEIGLHPSYGTYKTPELIKKEAERLKRVAAEEGIFQKHWGGRMHYLRWEQSTTLRAWNDACMTYDSTLGYADRPGFRCGTCHEYIAFDPVRQEELELVVRPLVAMECSIISFMYLGLNDADQILDKLMQLKSKCYSVGGMFTLLWHNSFFLDRKLLGIYEKIAEQ